ncbi:MAG: 16S rRNA (uracil(1498)-N(3))-methyltransferase [Myxococcales bacterium]|nr:16S rRNA (uracil(1498)-N(3))-methyltransferase [Myxococcales bacterium]
MAKRLLVDHGAISDDRALLGGDLARYVTRVLRFGVGDALSLCDGEGGLFEGRIDRVSGGRVEVAIAERRQLARPAGPRLWLLYGLAKASATETTLQKATELGVDRVTPVICERSVARPRDGDKKRARWGEIVRGAARQCERAFLPQVDEPQPLARALADCGASHKLIASVAHGQTLSAEGLAGAGEVALAVGPEGGFTDAEVAAAERAGFAPVSLGPTILRSETAAIALLAIVAYGSGRLQS